MIGAVVVAFNPDKSDFKQVLDSIVNQVDFLVVVNNGNKRIDFIDEYANLHIIENNKNLGIATALNIGLSFLIDKKCDYYLLLDHDSVVPKAMVSTLIEKLDTLNSTSKNSVAIIGPAYFNNRLNKFAPFIKYGRFRNIKIPMPVTPQLISVDFLISSGSLITKQALDTVGFMDEGLFIDFVDTEWCIRAKQKGYQLYAFSGVVMQHTLGDEALNFCGLKFPMHSPIRHYYIVRNALFLMKNKSYPINFKLIVFKLFIGALLFYSLIPKNRLDHLKMMLLGIKDGITNTKGKLDSAY